MKKAQITLVGRPNVGKSSLFNALIKKKTALVYDKEGVTRDRHMVDVSVEELNGRRITVCDTGGWVPEGYRKGREDQELLVQIETQVQNALKTSAVIVLVVDIRAGLTELDKEICQYIRKFGIPFIIAANKADKNGELYQMSDFYSLGGEDIIPLSAEHKLGLVDFWERVDIFLPESAEEEKSKEVVTRIAIVGRPNVGKSSFLNFLVGEDRAVVSDIPGTTTDPVDMEITRNGRKFLLIDTAGIRKHAKRKDDVEDLGVLFSKRNLDQADIAFFLIDAKEGLTTQDSRIADFVEDAGCTAIVFANKWDLAPQNIRSDTDDGLEKFKEIMDKQWPFLNFAPLVAISAQKGKLYGAFPGEDATEPVTKWRLPKAMEDLWDFTLNLVEAREQRISPAELKGLVEEAFAVGPNWVNSLGDFRQIHQVGTRPPQFLAFVRDANKIPEALRRYLKRAVREKYGFRGNPIRWVFKHRGEEK